MTPLSLSVQTLVNPRGKQLQRIVDAGTVRPSEKERVEAVRVRVLLHGDVPTVHGEDSLLKRPQPAAVATSPLPSHL